MSVVDSYLNKKKKQLEKLEYQNSANKVFAVRMIKIRIWKKEKQELE